MIYIDHYDSFSPKVISPSLINRVQISFLNQIPDYTGVLIEKFTILKMFNNFLNCIKNRFLYHKNNQIKHLLIKKHPFVQVSFYYFI